MQCCGSPLGQFAEIMQNISQEKRIQILCILSKVESLCVCEIIKKLGISQNLVSHHLKVLKDLGFVDTKKEGKNVHYMINTKKYNEFKKTLNHLFTM